MGYTTKYYVEHEIYANQNFSATDMWAASADFCWSGQNNLTQKK